MKGYAKIHHSLLSSAKVARLTEQYEGHIALAAIGLWTVMVTMSSERLTDGVVYLRDIAGWGSQEVITDAIGALGAVGLAEFESETSLRIVGYEEHNNTSEQVRALSQKRKKSGALGGKQNKKFCFDDAKAKAKQTVSVSDSVFVSDLNPDPERARPPGDPPPERPPTLEVRPPPLTLVEPHPPLAPAAPVDAQVRSALVTGYREAFEGRFGTVPTDVDLGALDTAIVAVTHRAGVTHRDPVELARKVGPMWLAGRTSPRIPRWDWFVEGIGEILAQAAVHESRDPDWEPVNVLGMLAGGAQ